MDVTRKQEVLKYLNGLGANMAGAAECVPELLADAVGAFQVDLDDVATYVATSSLFVPVVGGFSTGKSTALNKLVGRNVLPESVSPETAIPTELHFSEDERLMVQSQDGSWSQHALSALPALSAHAGDYQVVRVYLNSPELKRIQPLVLVDMPGFDSGLEQHNDAILRYITTGALYLYLVDCKAGTVSRQDSRRIEEILDLGRSVKVFLTKTDLVSEEQIQEAHEYVSEHLSMVTGDSGVGKINKDDVSALLDVVMAADVPALFDSMVLPQVKNLYFDADGLVNTAIKALSSDAETVARTREEAELALSKVEADRNRLLADAKQGGVSAKCDLIMGRLEKVLRNATDELAAQARTGEAALSKGVADLVRSTLTVEIQSLVRKSTSDIAYHFSGEINLGGLSLSSGEGDWVGSLISVVESQAMDALTGMQERISKSADAEETADREQTNAIGKVISSLGKASVAIPHPVLKVVVAILPGIIGQLFIGLRQSHKAAKYRDAISSQVIPGVMTQVRPQVLESLNSVEGEIIRVVSEQVAEKVSKQKSLFDEVAQRSDGELQGLREKQGALKDIRSAMVDSAKEVFA